MKLFKESVYFKESLLIEEEEEKEEKEKVKDDKLVLNKFCSSSPPPLLRGLCNTKTTPNMVEVVAKMGLRTTSFEEVVEEGKLYDLFAMVLNECEGMDAVKHYVLKTCNDREGSLVSRKDIKKAMFRDVLFGKSNNRKFCKLFRSLFPEVLEFIEELKKEDHKRLSFELTKEESKYMYLQVIQRLKDHHSEIPVVTIHDSIMTTEDNLAEVQRIMLEEFARLGLKATLKCQGAV
ncbi:MAG: hypothetical protein WCL32_20935 [Planctomycetota bacterium]